MFRHIARINSIFNTISCTVNNTTSSFQNSKYELFTCRKMATASSQRNWKDKKILVAGLGNHDRKGTRHSVGLEVVNEMATSLELNWKKEKNCLGWVATKEFVDRTQLILLKPKEAMNNNGKSVSKTVRFYGVELENVYIVHDELDMKIGKCSLKEGGSANGHNGVRSVMDSLRTDEVIRLRIGIGRPASRSQVSDFVLTRFSKQELSSINTAIQEGVKKIAQHMSEDGTEELKKILDSKMLESNKILERG